MRGRHPSGPEYVHKLEGSDEAKQRLQAVLETLGGTTRVAEACARLGLGEVRFHQLREEALQGALANLETKPAGRPSQEPTPTTAQVRSLEEKIRVLQVELGAAQTRAEIALTMPHLVQPTGALGKKTRREAKRRRKKKR